MAFHLVYNIGSCLYINLTNRCSNACTFCIREHSDAVGTADSLWLDREPTADEVFYAFQQMMPNRFSEAVFCGYGEPTERPAILLELARRIRAAYPNLRIRLNTNGQGNLLAGRDITAELAETVDCVSVSLNAANAQEYVQKCRPLLGAAAYDALLDFARKSKAHGMETILSIVAGETDETACRKAAEAIGAELRVRNALH